MPIDLTCYENNRTREREKESFPDINISSRPIGDLMIPIRVVVSSVRRWWKIGCQLIGSGWGNLHAECKFPWPRISNIFLPADGQVEILKKFKESSFKNLQNHEHELLLLTVFGDTNCFVFFFCLLIPEFGYIMFYFQPLCWVNFWNKSPKIDKTKRE